MATSPAHIRQAVHEDAEAVARLVTELGYPTTMAQMRERLRTILSDRDYMTFVAESDCGVLGVAGASIDPYFEKDGTYARLLVLAVSSAARSRGIGTLLVDAVERWSASKGAREVVVNSGQHRTDAHAFYERRGFARTGLRFVKQLPQSAG